MKQTIVLLVGLAVFAGGCATTETAEKTEVRVQVAADGSLSVEGEQTTLAGLGQALEKHILHKNAPIIVAADEHTETGQVVAVLEELKKLGHTNVSMVSR